MSEKQKLTIALRLISETSIAALASLAEPLEVDDISSPDKFNLSMLHKDFISLLSLIYAATTKLSLTLKPSSPAYKAALEPLKELSDRVASLPHCVRLLQIDYGRTLAAEAKSIAKDVLEALNSLVQIFIDIDSKGFSSGNVGSEYLVRTGAVHDIIDKARGHDGFSGNNLVAVRKIVEHNQESLDDGLTEVRETVESAKTPANGTGEEEEGEDFDDGWAELGISSTKPSPVELLRIKKIYTIIRLSTLFHQRTLKDVLSTLSPLPPLSTEINTILDDLANASSEFLSSSDNFICAMYPPQVVEHISVELEGYKRQFTQLQSKIDPLIPEVSVEEQLQNLQLYNTARSFGDYTKLRRWYIACITQVNKNVQELEHELKGSETPLS